MPELGLNLRVTSNGKQGGRQYMEDVTVVHFEESEDKSEVLFSYFAIFDGHGGVHAANYAKRHLLRELKNQTGFWSENDESVLNAIKVAFLITHRGMWKVFESWPKTSSGMPSTSGTTASIVVLRGNKVYVGHVGDSGIVLGYQEKEFASFKAQPLTQEHKPDSPEELKRIEEDGGAVANKAGVQRVVWNRPKPGHIGPVRRSTPIDKVPFLAVARSLGDLWSYNFTSEKFVVSPEPDVSVHVLDPAIHRCIILGSDGLWNMLRGREAVEIVQDVERETDDKVLHDYQGSPNFWINPSITLVDVALQKWRLRTFKADNTSCITIMIDPPGPSKSVRLRRQRALNMRPKHFRTPPPYYDSDCEYPDDIQEEENSRLEEEPVAEKISVLKESQNSEMNKLNQEASLGVEPLKKQGSTPKKSTGILSRTDSSNAQLKKCSSFSPNKNRLQTSVCESNPDTATAVSNSELPLQETDSNQPSVTSHSSQRLSLKQTVSSEKTVSNDSKNQTETPTTLRPRNTRLSCAKIQSQKETDSANGESDSTQNLSPALVPSIWPSVSDDTSTLRKSCRRKSRAFSVGQRKSRNTEQDQNTLNIDAKASKDRSNVKRSGLKRKLSAGNHLLPCKRFKHSTRSTSKPMTRLHLNKILRK